MAWEPLIAGLRSLAPFTLEGALPEETARFDTVQLQQALINLLKNAHESGSPPGAVTLAVRQGPRD